MKIYGTIEKSEKQADGTMIVMGYASSESKDVDGEIIKADAIKGAIPDYMKFANVREMHKSDKAAGTVLEMEVQDDGRTWVKTHIVDAEACKKVEHKVYKGFSIGGKVTARDADDKTIIKAIKLSEISLVDRPANPDSIFTFAKVDDGEGDGAGAGVDATKPAVKEGEKPAAVDAKETETKTVEPAKEPETKDKPADEGKDAAAGKKDDVKKGMGHVSSLAYILKEIQWLVADQEAEAAREGDGSQVPAEIMNWLRDGGKLLVAMVTEEVGELTGDDDGGEADMLVLSAKAKDLMKVACTSEDAEKFVKGFDKMLGRRADVLAKAGKRNSSADQKHLNAIHDAACAMGAACDTTKAAAGKDDIAKRAADVDAIAKVLENIDGDDVVAKVGELVKIVDTVMKRVVELEAMPKPAKAILSTVNKSGDATQPEKTEDETIAKTDTPVDAMKKLWRSGGKVE